MLKKTFWLGGLILLVLAADAAAADLCTDPVNTESGLVAGLAEAGGATCVWRGIPYAAAPVGELRWKAPRPAPKWTGVKEAKEFGPRCMQKGMMESVNADPSGRMSEDCLFLNIWRPKREGKFPVMVWIHGGGYTGGTGNTEMYWGDRLSEKGVVVVTINYRLGVFGFLAHPVLRTEDPNHSTGNYGSLDQVAALQWVHNNIADFGGDPDQVTIFGESAGGWSVCTMIATPLNRGLFQRAIIESGGCEASQELETGYAQARTAAEKAGCQPEDIACLRRTPAEKLIRNVMGGIREGFTWQNHYDGYLLTGSPLSMIRAGNFNRVSLIAGHNRNETDAIVGLIVRDLSKAKPEDYEQGLQQLLGIGPEEARRLTELYPLSRYNNQVKTAAGQIASDMALACPTYSGLSAVAEHGLPVYYYRFDFHQMRFGSVLGALHAMELPFVFNSLDRPPINLLYGPKQRKTADPLVKIIHGYWLNFSKTGDPNSPDLPAWPRFDPQEPQVQVLDTQVRPEKADMKERCAFWEEYNRTHPPIFRTMGKPQGKK